MAETMREQIWTVLCKSIHEVSGAEFNKAIDAILALINSPENVERVAKAIGITEATIMRDRDRLQQSADPRALARAALKALVEGEDV